MQRRSIGLSLAAMLLVSCARAGVDDQVSSSSDRADQAKASEVVVTGSLAIGTRQAVPAPPPPPPPMMAAPAVQGFALARPERGWAPPYHDQGRDKFTTVAENAFKIVREAPVSTFSIDVDTASYSWVRASLNHNVLPQPAAQESLSP